MKMENKVENKVQISQKITRRKFIGVAAGTTAAFTIVPRYVLGGSGHTPPSEKLNVAGVGVGGMGAINIDNIAGIARDKDGNIISQHEGENIVALCDVDDDYAGKVYDRYPNAKVHHDFRKMLDKQKDIDAVIVATPDHTHAVIAMAAMKRGKHVYVQKPLTRTVYEARMLTEAARKYKVVTQMGNQGHSGDGVRDICEWIWADVIGEVKEVHAWTNRPVWPQGIDRPKDTPEVPPTLNWDLWVGPAPMRPYHPAYLPRLWRGWWDFGCFYHTKASACSSSNKDYAPTCVYCGNHCVSDLCNVWNLFLYIMRDFFILVVDYLQNLLYRFLIYSF